MRQWVLSVPFPLRFLFASQPKIMGKALGIVYRAIASHLTRKAGYTKSTAYTGAVTLIQRFGSALNLNIHFHMIFLDGVYVDDASSVKKFRWVKAPTNREINQLSHVIAHRLARYLERQGLLEKDVEHSYLTLESSSSDCLMGMSFRGKGVNPSYTPRIGYYALMATLDKQLVELLSRYPEFELAILFGSQATGRATEGSDIDLALLADAPISSGLKLELIELIGARFGRPVDIVDLYYAAEPILGQVFKGRRLLGDNATYARLLTKHLLNTADFVPLQQRILAERQVAWTK